MRYWERKWNGVEMTDICYEKGVVLQDQEVPPPPLPDTPQNAPGTSFVNLMHPNRIPTHYQQVLYFLAFF